MLKKNLITLVFLLLVGLFIISCKNRQQVQPEKDYSSYNENLIKANKGLLKIDEERIQSYAKRRKWDMKTTKTGLWYSIYETGTGAKTKFTNIVTIKYRVELLDGTLCYTSDSLGTKTLKLGQGGVETGLEEGLMLMKEGDKAHFIMPPYMAHGLLGDENKIPSRAIIVYNVELLKVTD